MLRPTTKSRLRTILYLFVFGGLLLVLTSRRSFQLSAHEYDDDLDENILHPDQQQQHPPPLLDVPSEPLKLDPPPPTPEELEKQHYAPYCPPHKCAYGHWLPRSPPFTTFEEAHKAIIYNKNDHGYGLPDPHPPRAEGVELTEEEKKQGGRERVLEMSNWVWHSDFGEMVKFDTEEFVIRLLKSAGGLFLIGDSLTTQHLMTVRHRFLQADLMLHENLDEWPFKDHPHVHQYRLDLNHPPCKALIQRAGIPESRARRPILTHIVDQTLVTPKELNTIFRTDWGYVHGHKYTQVEGWKDFVAEMTKKREGEWEAGVKEDSLVVISSGAHWSRAGLHGYNEQLETEELRRRIEYAYSEMVKITISSLSPLPHTTLFFRSISPGHPSCNHVTKPFSSLDEAREWFAKPGNDQPEVVEWDWDSFGERNGVWREGIKAYEEKRLEGTKDGNEGTKKGLWKGKGSKWVYLDFWEMDLQRVDAHTLTETRKGHWDCLHYAMPYVHNQWTDMLFHYLVVEKRLQSVKEKERQEE